MIVKQLYGKSGYKIFSQLGALFNEHNPHYKPTDESIERLLLLGPTSFHEHAHVRFYALYDNDKAIARFALIHDEKLKDYVQVSFFEAAQGCGNLYDVIKNEAKKQFPAVPKIVVGLNGHLNYGAGILLNKFDADPIFGLPYSQNYYAQYFDELERKEMVTFRFHMQSYIDWFNKFNIQRIVRGVSTRNMDKKNIKRDIEIYTKLNNASFQNHPYWADRTIAEDMELMYPFRHLLKEENLIFAEFNGEPIGFFLWYPDFNQLVNGRRDLKMLDVIKYKFGAKIDSFRFAEIAVRPEYKRSSVSIALIMHAVPYIEKRGIDYCECGFIFEENYDSMQLMRRFMTRFYGSEIDIYRRFAVFEGNLNP